MNPHRICPECSATLAADDFDDSLCKDCDSDQRIARAAYRMHLIDTLLGFVLGALITAAAVTIWSQL